MVTPVSEVTHTKLTAFARTKVHFTSDHMESLQECGTVYVYVGSHSA